MSLLVALVGLLFEELDSTGNDADFAHQLSSFGLRQSLLQRLVSVQGDTHFLFVKLFKALLGFL